MLPIISGLNLISKPMGSILNSPALERGIIFLEKFKQLKLDSASKRLENFFDNKLYFTGFESQKIYIDISDPLNLKILWPENILKSEPKRNISFLRKPLMIQMGSREFEKRLITFQKIFPVLDKKHPNLKSIDLRYGNRVMLVP